MPGAIGGGFASPEKQYKMNIIQNVLPPSSDEMLPAKDLSVVAKAYGLHPKSTKPLT